VVSPPTVIHDRRHGHKDKRQELPAEAEQIRARLERARDEGFPARVRSWIPDADLVDGFVVALGREWVALARLSDRIELNGWTMLRLKHVRAVKLTPDPDAFKVKALKARGQWPPTPPSVRLDDVSDLVTDVAATASMVAVHCELDRPDVCWIGAVREVKGKTLSLLDVKPNGSWDRKPQKFDLDDVTRLDFGDGYQDALLIVAGPAPMAA